MELTGISNDKSYLTAVKTAAVAQDDKIDTAEFSIPVIDEPFLLSTVISAKNRAPSDEYNIPLEKPSPVSELKFTQSIPKSTAVNPNILAGVKLSLNNIGERIITKTGPQ